VACTITVGVNSWVTIADADAYFEARYNTTAWAGLTNANKCTLLRHSYAWIQQQRQFNISANSVLEVVNQAQFEAAWYIYNYFSSHEKRRALYTQGVRNFRVSDFSEKLEMPEFPAWIADMLDDFLTNIGGQFPYVQRAFE